jgi:hypothetical protein
MRPIYLDEETSRYMDIHFNDKTINWNKPHDERSTRKRIPARACNGADFGTDEVSANFYRNWKGFSLVCPELKNVKNIDHVLI